MSSWLKIKNNYNCHWNDTKKKRKLNKTVNICHKDPLIAFRGTIQEIENATGFLKGMTGRMLGIIGLKDVKIVTQSFTFNGGDKRLNY